MNKNVTKILILLFIFFIGIGLGFQADYLTSLFNGNNAIADDLQLDDQEATIRAIKKVMPSVVNIIVYDQEESLIIDIRTGKQTIDKEIVKKGSGTGFLISSDGLILTNKHVVNAGDEKTAEYRIILHNGKQYYAQFIGKDPLNDLAVLKIFDKDLPYVELGDSSKLQVGTTVIAIGNVLGRYQNSVTKGIISGLGRNIIASDQSGNIESLDNIIQTDAEINLGNSGGPLVDLEGRVIGVNVAIDQAGSAIGFAIPINDARPVITSVREIGRIVRARAGVRYLMLTPEIAQDRGLDRDSGALIIDGRDGSPGVLKDSPAYKGGLQTGDIVFEINAIKIKGTDTLLSVIQRYKPGDKIGMKIQRGNKIIIRILTLDEFK